MLHLSLRCSTFSPSCSSSSCSSVHAHTSARLRRGSLTVTSKGTCLPLFLCNAALPSFSFHRMPVPLPAIFRIHVRIRLSCFPVCQLLPVLESLGFSLCPRESVSLVIPPSYTQTSLLTDQPKPVFPPCAGERLSPYVALACIAMAVRMILS